MNNQLRSILGELYALDPELQAHETELIPILETMLRMRPDVTPDPAFVQQLRMTLREKAAANAESPSSSFFSFFTMNHLQYTLTGLVLGAVVAAPLTYSLTQSGEFTFAPTPSDGTQKLFSYSVEDKGSAAFGDLSKISNASGQGGAESTNHVDTSMMMTRPQSGGGGGGISDKMLVAPEMVEYNLVFGGEMPQLADSVDVYKRQKNTAAADLSRILGSFNTGLIDLTSFRGAKTDMISFYQDTDYGYFVTVSFREGSISLNQNWEQWPHPESNCRDEACYQSYRVKMEDIPADDVLIDIAQDFVEEHSIDLSQYGAPEVDRQWRTQYEAATDKSMIYLPDSVRVTYPMLVDGKPVFDEGGTKAGISLGINVRVKRVSDAWGIVDQKYQKSAYAGVTDAAQITTYLENYGKIQGDWMPPNTTKRTVDITLGTPEVSLVRMYTYANNVNEELLVPALVFPVSNVPSGEYFYNTSITIPLASDLLKQRTDMGNPVPMPLIMEDAARAETE